MKASIFFIFALSLMASSAWAAHDDEDMDTLQSYSDTVNEAVTYAEEEDNNDRDERDLRDITDESSSEGVAESPYSFNSGRIAQILDEDHRDEDEEDLQQRYAAMHDEDAAEEDNVAL